ncbi:hypothetical protein NP233_g5525 [Leucocoprinus birnbaumii]|uniref:Polysaccharide lyase 14 domain-containing protein n=1 Tax=Leucocoprinus birnbaumii TaxID=56174 RepID=A0AAD5VV25_9AGAR|nr:hypothetical protein NP233_g5525 [Leucocoprinus birnbaumii]
MTNGLIPMSKFKNGFTTCGDLDEDDRITVLALNDSALGVHKINSGTTHKLVNPPKPSKSSSGLPPPKKAWEAIYPKGSINPGGPTPGGFGFYLSGPDAFAKQLQAGAKEIIMSYRMMLEKDWEWVKGGKLPGWFGGEGDLAYKCSGGRQDQRCQCFDMRPMWRTSGLGELYTYLPLTDQNEEVLKKIPPKFVGNPQYGFSVGRGAYKFQNALGNWVSVACRIKLNDVGSTNGEIELWIDGKSVIKGTGLLLRNSKTSIIKGMHFETFFGGNTKDWASPKEQRAWFADVTGVIL